MRRNEKLWKSIDETYHEVINRPNPASGDWRRAKGLSIGVDSADIGVHITRRTRPNTCFINCNVDAAFTCEE